MGRLTVYGKGQVNQALKMFGKRAEIILNFTTAGNSDQLAKNDNQSRIPFLHIFSRNDYLFDKRTGGSLVQAGFNRFVIVRQAVSVQGKVQYPFILGIVKFHQNSFLQINPESNICCLTLLFKIYYLQPGMYN